MRFLAVCLALGLCACGKLNLGSSPDAEQPVRPLTEEIEDPISEKDAAGFVGECRSQMKRSGAAKEVPPRYLSDGVYHWQTIPYTLDARSETIQLFAKLTIDVEQFPVGERTQTLQRLQGVRQCMRDFFLRHDIFLQLELLDPSAPEASKPGDSSYVTIRPKGIRVTSYNMSNWSFELDGLALSDEIACTVMTHEFSHMLGLRDEYADTGRTNRIGESDSLMRTCTTAPSETRLYSRHMRTILKSGCSEERVAETAVPSPKRRIVLPR